MGWVVGVICCSVGAEEGSGLELRVKWSAQEVIGELRFVSLRSENY
jgi:hypothetical protein